MTRHSARIRPATATELPWLQNIEVEAATRFPPETLPSAAATPLPFEELAACLMQALLWVADEPGAGVVGFMAAREESECLHILEMDVLEGYGQRGIGTALLQHACRAAGERRHRHVTLTTFAHLPWNAPFYARHGFEVVSNFTAFPHLAAALQSEQQAGLAQRVAMVATCGERQAP